jgi:hypothetical protein
MQKFRRKNANGKKSKIVMEKSHRGANDVVRKFSRDFFEKKISAKIIYVEDLVRIDPSLDLRRI